MEAGPGPEALKWIREMSGLTQREMAVRSGVSERTVRALERGQVRKPHSASLDALADAAQVSPWHRSAFLRAWRPDRIRSLGELTETGSSSEDAVAETVLQSALAQTILHIWARYLITPERTCTVQARTVVEARHDGVDSFAMAVVYDTDPFPSVRPRVEGATLRRCHELSNPQALICEFELPRTLATGEQAAFTYTSEVTDLPLLAPGEIDDTVYLTHRPLPILVLELVFTDHPPVTVWEIEAPSTLRGRRRRTHPHAVDAQGRVQVVWRNASPGVHGLEWETPESPVNASLRLREPGAR